MSVCPAVLWHGKMVSAGQSWCKGLLVETALSCASSPAGAQPAITATLERQVAAAGSVIATPKAPSTVTVTVHPGSASASRELRGSAVRNACRDTS